jgi:GrpB-like predicted nucleotidyltransferase (UPF0157 family)
MPPVEIVDYDPRWPHEFAAIGRALRGALGDLALRIDHIGSTSAPGLAAKDRIDVQLTVAGFERFAPVQAALEQIGYTSVAQNTRDHRRAGLGRAGSGATYCLLKQAACASPRLPVTRDTPDT